MKRFLLPFGVFIVLVAFLGIGLRLNPREVPSPLIGKSAPGFELPQVHQADRMISQKELLGKVWLFNVWASWCVSCRVEHPVLVELAKARVVPLVGLNYKEVRGDGSLDASRLSPEQELALARERAAGWLARHGDPYAFSVIDLDGRLGIDYGVYGVPETFLIDKSGIIRHKHIGPLTPETVQQKLIPLIQELNARS